MATNLFYIPLAGEPTTLLVRVNDASGNPLIDSDVDRELSAAATLLDGTPLKMSYEVARRGEHTNLVALSYTAQKCA